MVVLAHLAEDRLYYARLLVMETEGELFNAQLKNTPGCRSSTGTIGS
jgi:hypothetical protein